MFRRTVSELERIDVRLKIFLQPSRLNNNEVRRYEPLHIPGTDILKFADQFLSLIRMILILQSYCIVLYCICMLYFFHFNH